MGRVSRIQTAFNAGELSPLLDGRPDLQKYGAALRRCDGFLPLVQGPARRRGGFRYLGNTKDNGKVLLLEFTRSRKTAYVLELGDGYARFWTRRGQVTVSEGDNAGDIYEIESPYTLANLFDEVGMPRVQATQSGDILYIACPDMMPQKLMYRGPNDWEFKQLDPKGGPWNDANPDKTLSIAVSGSRDGSVSLSASASVFKDGHVGSLLRLELADLSGIPPWVGDTRNQTEPKPQYCRNDGKTYLATGWKDEGRRFTGNVPPTHTRGSEWDGVGERWIDGDIDETRKVGTLWQFRDTGYGIVRITSVPSGTQAAGTVVSGYELPDMLMGSSTWLWQFGAWSNAAQFPSCCTFFRERLTFGGGIRVWCSKSGDFENFEDKTFGEVNTDNAVTVTVVTEQGVDTVAGLASMASLIAITGGGEVVVSEASAAEPLGPENVRVNPQSSYGGMSLKPVKIGSSCLFAQAGGRKVREIAYDDLERSINAPDITVFSEHITRPGLLSFAYQQEPYSILWGVRSDGVLLGLTHDRGQEVSAWHRHVIGGNGKVESIACIPAYESADDELYACIAVEVEGETRRFVCCLDEGLAPGGNLRDAFFLDCGKTVESATPTKEFTSLDHLNGLTVDILADGGTVAPQTVVEGKITLPRAASVVQVGLQYESRLETTFVEAGAQAGTAQGQRKSIKAPILRVNESAGGEVGSPASDRWQTIFSRDVRDKMNNPVGLVTGDIRNVPWPGGWETEGSVGIRQLQPFPLCVVALVFTVEVNEQ